MTLALTTLVTMALYSDPNPGGAVDVLREAYARAQKLDWDTPSGQRQVWQGIGNALAVCTKGWPLRTMGIDRLRTRLEVLAVKAGLVDETDPPKRSMLSFCFEVAPVHGSRDGVVLLATIDRSVEKGLGDTAALLYVRSERGARVASVLQASEDNYLLLGPQSARLTSGGLLLGGLSAWMGNGPNASALFFKRWPDRWACVSSAESNFESWDAPVFRSVKGGFVYTALGRTYPKNVGVCHAEANVAMASRFWFDGRRLTAHDFRLPNAWAMFDDLVGAARHREVAKVRRLCLTRRLADRATSILRAEETLLGASTPNNVNTLDDHVFVLRETGYRFTFKKSEGHWLLARISKEPYGDR